MKGFRVNEWDSNAVPDDIVVDSSFAALERSLDAACGTSYTDRNYYTLRM